MDVASSLSFAQKKTWGALNLSEFALTVWPTILSKVRLGLAASLSMNIVSQTDIDK